MAQRRCFLCGRKIRPGQGDRLGRIVNGKCVESHLFCGAGCGNVWMIWHGGHARWNGVRWSRNRYYNILVAFEEKFLNMQRPLPDDCMELLEQNLWSLV